MLVDDLGVREGLESLALYNILSDDLAVELQFADKPTQVHGVLSCANVVIHCDDVEWIQEEDRRNVACWVSFSAAAVDS